MREDVVEGVGIVGVILVMYSVGYIRGRFDESGMELEAWATQVAEVGPHWPVIIFLVGMVILGASAGTLFMIQRRKSKRKSVEI